jgi:biopolymer transport protein ExbD
MAFAPSRVKRHDTSSPKVQLNLTSMMDMFTIILVFLIKNYNTEGLLLHPSHSLTLPSSTVQKTAEVALNIVASRDWIMVNDEPVEKMAMVTSAREFYVPQLGAVLLKYATEAKRMEETYGAKFSGKVVIQGDRKLPFNALLKIMATCGRSDYPNMRLVVYEKS